MSEAATRIPAAEYTAIVKPRVTHNGGRSHPPGVTLVLKKLASEELDQVYSFSSWSYLRERLRVFGLATAKELEVADVRLSTAKQPVMFSARLWALPLIDALDLNVNEF
jgi:hypothetical protein